MEHKYCRMRVLSVIERRFFRTRFWPGRSRLRIPENRNLKHGILRYQMSRVLEWGHLGAKKEIGGLQMPFIRRNRFPDTQSAKK